MALIFLLAIHEKKRLVLLDRPANRAAKLVQVELLRRGGKVALGIEIGIAHKLEERAVNVVGSRFGGDQHGRTGTRSVFGGVGVGQYLELLNVIDRGKDADAARGQFVVVDAVQQPVRAVGTRAAHRQRERTARRHLAVAARGEKAVGVGLRRRARRERGELHEVAAIQRKLRHLLRGDDLAQRWIGRLNRDRVAGNGHCRDDRSGHDRKVEFPGFIDLEPQIFGFSTLKSARVHAHVVGADRKQRYQVVARTVGLPVPRKAGRLRSSDNRRSRDNRPGFIKDVPGETSRALRMRYQRNDKCEREKNEKAADPPKKPIGRNLG